MWLFFSLLTALFESLKDVFSKKSLAHLDEYVVAWAIRFFSLPFLFSALIFVPFPRIESPFWSALAIGGILNAAATIYYMKALKYADLSVSVPMVTFTPVFLLVTSPLLVGEFPAPLGLAGIFLIVIGSYIMHIRDSKNGFFAPFKSLMKEKGPRFMLIVAFLWSITSNFDKIGIANSSVFIWVAATHLFGAIALFPIIVHRVLKKKSDVNFNRLKTLISIGGIDSLRSLFQMSAIGLTLVAYVIAIKRTSAIFAIFFGYFIFREKGFIERLAGAIFMVLGVLCISFS